MPKTNCTVCETPSGATCICRTPATPTPDTAEIAPGVFGQTLSPGEYSYLVFAARN